MKERQKQQPIETPASIRQPELQPLTLEHIEAFVKKTNTKPLSNQNKKEIAQFLQSSWRAKELANLMEEFTSTYTHYDNLAGLTPDETRRLNALAKIRNEFKSTHKKGEYDGPGFKRFIANERKIVAFNQAINWWKNNLASLRKLQLWEDISGIITTNARNENIPPNALRERLHTLGDIKYTWSQHQMFASFSSQNLLEYEQHYISTMEKTIVDFLSSNNKTPNAVREYLYHTLYNIRSAHRQAIQSMIARLTAMEKNEDVESDDILYHLIDEIETRTHITLEKKGKRPDARKGLTPDIINDYVKRIKLHIETHPDDTSISDELNKLSAAKTPYNWATHATSITRTSVLSQNPTICFSANHIPLMLSKAAITRDLHQSILKSIQDNRTHTMIARIKKMLSAAQAEIKKQSLKNNKLDEFIIDEFIKWENDLNAQTNQIQLRISIEIRNTIQQSIDNIFSDEILNHDHLARLTEYLSTSNEFDNMFGNESYDPDKDILLAISSKIKQMIEKNKPITKDMLSKLSRLILIADIYDTPISSKQIYNRLLELPELVKGIHNNDDAYILHFITHHIESTFITKESIQPALNRHHYIDNLYERKNTSTPLSNDMTLHYIESVILPLAHKHPHITLANFESSTVTNLLSCMKNKSNNFDCPLDLPDSLQKQFQVAISKKINHFFEIKKYLYDSKTRLLQTDKLKSLVQRTQVFFTDQRERQVLQGTIASASYSILKTHIINLIQSDQPIDFDYINRINSLLDKDIISMLANDKEIDQLLINYIEFYSGSNNNVGQLMVAFGKANPDFQHDDIIYKFANKRLTYIANGKNINSQDYHFFNHYKHHPTISGLYKRERQRHQSAIHHALAEKRTWKKHLATTIELFGNKQQIDTYRFKRVRELLTKSVSNNLSHDQANKLLDEFIETVDKNTTIKGKLVNSRNTVINNTTLHTYLDYASNSKPWTPILETIIKEAGTTEQLQTLHYRHLHKALSISNEISNSLLGKQLIQLQSNNIETYSDNLISFFGKQNIAKLCAQIEKILSTLQAASLKANQNELSNEDYQLYMALIRSLKPVKSLYITFSNSQGYIDIMNSLDSIEHKIQLHNALQDKVSKQTSLFSIGSNDTIHNGVLTLMKNVLDLDGGNLITSDNVHHYVKFCSSDILDKIINLIDKQEKHIDTPVLLTFMDLTSELVTNHLKIELMNAHRQDVLKQPVWLMLINHLDENAGLNAVIEYLTNQQDNADLGPEFSELFEFSKKLVYTKKLIRHSIKKHLLQQADINHHPNKAIKLSTILNDQHLSDTKLLTLWRNIIQHFVIDGPPTIYSTPGHRYLLAKAGKVSRQLLKRAHDNPDLLSKFMDTFLVMSDTFKNKDKQNSNPSAHLSLWSTQDDTHKALAPIISIAQHAVITMLIHAIEKYATEHTKPDMLQQFQQIANDPVFLDKNQSMESRSHLFDGITSSHKAKTSLALAFTADLYHQARLILDSKAAPQTLTDTLNRITADVESSPIVGKMKPMKTLLSQLHDITKLNPLIKNDHKFINKSALERFFSFS